MNDKFDYSLFQKFHTFRPRGSGTIENIYLIVLMYVGMKSSESFTIHRVVQMFVTTSRRLPPSWYSPSPFPVGTVATSIYLPLRHLAAVSMRPPLRIPLSRPRFIPRTLPLHPRRNGAFLFHSCDIRLARTDPHRSWSFLGQQNCAAKIHFFKLNFSKIYYIFIYIYT